MRAWAVVKNEAPLEEIELPTPEPKGTEVLLETTYCGVCHSDLHIWEGRYDLGGGKVMNLTDRGLTLPIAMGHEIVGRVVKLGPDAKGVKIGDIRIVFPWVGCGTCAACLADEDNMCLTPKSLGVYQHGGYATHVVAPHPRHLVDPGNVDHAVAATYACSGITVFSAIKKVMPLPADEPIVLVGAGGLGLNAIAVLRALKHRNIVVSTFQPKSAPPPRPPAPPKPSTVPAKASPSGSSRPAASSRSPSSISSTAPPPPASPMTRWARAANSSRSACSAASSCSPCR